MRKSMWKTISRVVLGLLAMYIAGCALVVFFVKGVQYYKSGSNDSYDQKFGLCHSWYNCPLRIRGSNEESVSFLTLGEKMPEGRDFENFAGFENGMFCPLCLWNFFCKPKHSASYLVDHQDRKDDIHETDRQEAKVEEDDL